MHPLTLLKVVGTLLMVLGVAQLVPAAVSALYGDEDWHGFLYSAGGAAGIGGVLYAISRRARELSIRDGFFVVTTVWVTACVAGAVPFWITGTFTDPVDALFEATSGFTTTGASVVTDYASLSHGVLLWRAMSQWFGGMGIIVLALAILPALGIAGMQLYRREMTGPYQDKITPRLRDTAKALWSVYIALTATEALILSLLGMPVFEAICHAMTTVSTAGFGTRAESIGAFDSAAIEWTVIAFMYIGGVNFALHYRMFRGPGGRFGYLGDLEWRCFTVGIVVICAAVSLYLYLVQGYSPGAAITKGSFQVVSIATTTGFASDNYVLWGAFPQLLLLLLMLVGGSAGSTAGGIKVVRVLLVVKNIHVDMLRLIHPNVVVHAKLNDVPITEQIQSNINSFVVLFLGSTGLLTLLISLDGHSILTSLGAAASAMANIGPALEELGPAGHFGDLSDYAKLVLLGGMLLGRLELMTVLMIFLPRTWRL